MKHGPTIDVLFVLRGRPGLGHVIPGLAIADEFRRRGYGVGVMTYANGESFLARSGDSYGFELVRPLGVREEYHDWPGLDLYDHGVREIGPLLAEERPSLCVFGGEYVMAPIGAAAGVRSAMMFNPEIMEDNPRNELPSRLFCSLFASCEELIPLAELVPGRRYLPEFESLRQRLTPPGPFCFARRGDGGGAGAGRTILIANGGGVNFPRQTTSYSSEEASPATWLEETRRMTTAAARAAVSRMRGEDRVHVFSCLGEEFNERLREDLGGGDSVEVGPPSDRYYDVLGRADLVISRSGNGFIADAQTTDSVVLLWSLSGHDEQRQNAAQLARTRPATRFCGSEDELRLTVERVLAENYLADERPEALRHGANVVRLVDRLTGQFAPERKR